MSCAKTVLSEKWSKLWDEEVIIRFVRGRKELSMLKRIGRE